MQNLTPGIPFLVSPVRKLRGGSQPILAQASDGLLYVVKFADNLQGPHLLFNEYAGSALYSACRLSVPEWQPLLAEQSFIDRSPACWIETENDLLRPRAGLCFGSRYLGNDGKRLIELLPRSYFKRVENLKDLWLAWLVDICAGHTDNRQAIFEEVAEQRLQACFIDHGHMFHGATGDGRANSLACRYLDASIYPELLPREEGALFAALRKIKVDILWQEVQAMPDDWKTSSALGSFADCLSKLSTSHIVENMMQTLQFLSQGAKKTVNGDTGIGYLGAKILRGGVPFTGTGVRGIA